MGVVSSRRRCVLFEERRVSDAVVEFTASWDREHSISASGSATGSAGTAKEGRLESPRSGLFEGGPGENLEITNQSQIFWWVLCTASGVVFIVSAIAKFMLKTRVDLYYTAIFVLIFGAMAVYGARRVVVKESLLVVRDLGVQLERRYLSGLVESVFLEKASIRSVIIHEYVKFSGVGTCLAFVVEGAPELAVCFAHIYPGFDCIRRVYVKCAEGGAMTASPTRRPLGSGRPVATTSPAATTTSTTTASNGSGATGGGGGRRMSANSAYAAQLGSNRRFSSSSPPATATVGAAGGRDDALISGSGWK